jgi:feruloyl-CoA synthase
MSRDADGTIRLASNIPLRAADRQVGVWLRRWADAAPDRPFLAERDPTDAWRTVRYGEARERVDGLSQALLDRGLGPDRPLAILSEKSIDHGLLALAAMQVGIPVAPISPAYSLLSPAVGRLRRAIDLAAPALVYVADGRLFSPALRAIARAGREVVHNGGAPEGVAATPFQALAETRPTADVERAFDRVGPAAVAKILFTSGSTGEPKGVPNTHGMLCTNQAALAQLFPCFEDVPPTVVDWQPWHHAGGANYNFNIVLRNGGTYWCDLGKPTAEAIGTTLANLRGVSPTVHFNVPRGWAMLIPRLEGDADLRESFFRRLQVIVYSAASLPPELWRRLEALSVAARGVRVPMISAWGMTETAPLHTTCHWPIDRAGLIGVPIPGSELKLVPAEGRYEMRCRGPNVMTGYVGRPDLTAAAFDDEGFLRTGDAGRLVDPDDPNKGLVFDGRLVEDFKLLTGNRVHAGEVRLAAIGAGAPVVQDAVVVGENRDEVGLLVFPNLEECRRLAGAPSLASEALLRHPAVIARLTASIAAHNRAHAASSRRIGRALLLAEPPSLDAGEITDKGYVNQRAVIRNRAALVERLYAENDPDVILF